MKFNKKEVHGTRRDQWMLATAGALIVGIASLGFVGSTTLANGGDITDPNGGEGNPRDDDDQAGNPGFGGFQTDEEYVGTLPTVGDDEEASSAPGFYLEGPRQAVLNAFVTMAGNGHFVVQEVEGSDDLGSEPMVRVSFDGNLVITLDKCILDSTETKIGVFASTSLGATLASAMTEATLLMVEPVSSSGSVEIPCGTYEQNGLLAGGVHVVTYNRVRGRDHMAISTIGGLIQITQGEF